MKHPIATFLLVTSGVLLGSAALAQLPPPPGSEPAPAPSPSPGGLLGGGSKSPSSGDVKSECTTSAKKAGLTGKEQDDYVKQCVSKGGSK